MYPLVNHHYFTFEYILPDNMPHSFITPSRIYLTVHLDRLLYIWRAAPQPKDSLMIAAIFGSLYSIARLSAILFPGDLTVDPEFGQGFPQFWLLAGMTGLPWLGRGV